MRPDNPNFRPCAAYGFDAVGKGWHPILDELDHQFVMITGLGTSEHMKIKVLQIKEKFGAMRVYVNISEVPEDRRNPIYHAIRVAEEESAKTCEKCGSQEGVETRGKKDQKFGWVRTLCAEHHREQDNLTH